MMTEKQVSHIVQVLIVLPVLVGIIVLLTLLLRL